MTPILAVKGKRIGQTSHTALAHVNEQTGERTVLAEAKSERTIAAEMEENGDAYRGDISGWGNLVRVDEDTSMPRFLRMNPADLISENSVTVPRPEGMTDQEHADALSEAADTYEDGSKEYSPLPHLESNTLIGGDEYGNSNAFVGSVIRAVGGEGFHPGGESPIREDAPGWTLDILE